MTELTGFPFCASSLRLDNQFIVILPSLELVHIICKHYVILVLTKKYRLDHFLSFSKTTA